jgi:hypothetical protein
MDAPKHAPKKHSRHGAYLVIHQDLMVICRDSGSPSKGWGSKERGAGAYDSINPSHWVAAIF